MTLSHSELWLRISEIVLPLGFDVDDSGAFGDHSFWDKTDEDGNKHTLIRLETAYTQSIEVDIYDHEKNLVSSTTVFLPDADDADVWAIFEDDLRDELEAGKA